MQKLKEKEELSQMVAQLLQTVLFRLFLLRSLPLKMHLLKEQLKTMCMLLKKLTQLLMLKLKAKFNRLVASLLYEVWYTFWYMPQALWRW